MKIFEVTIRHNSYIRGAAESVEQLQEALPEVLATLIDPEVVSIEDLGEPSPEDQQAIEDIIEANQEEVPSKEQLN